MSTKSTVITVNTSSQKDEDGIPNTFLNTSLTQNDSFNGNEILRCSSCEEIFENELGDTVSCSNCSALKNAEKCDDQNTIPKDSNQSSVCCCKCHETYDKEREDNKDLQVSCGDDTYLDARLSSPNRSIVSEKICRICLDNEDQGTLIAPCKCTGSTKYAHEECLLKWFFKSSNKSCEVCLGTVNVTPVGYKPVQEWRLPERGCDFIVYLFGLYFVIMVIFTGMITWIATQKCASPVCVTLYVVCGVALVYFFYCCGCVEYSRRYWSSLLSVNRVWRIYGREDSLKNVTFNVINKNNKKIAIVPVETELQIQEPYVIQVHENVLTDDTSANETSNSNLTNAQEKGQSNAFTNSHLLLTAELSQPSNHTLSTGTSHVSDNNLGYDNPSIVIVDEN